MKTPMPLAPHPYDNLPPEAFWRTGVVDPGPDAIAGVWKPRFRIRRRTRFATAGSCFSQRIGQSLLDRGYAWIDAEPAPSRLPQTLRKDFYYGVFSFRTGNIYTPNLLAQWLEWAFGHSTPPDEVWERDGRFYDPWRPAIEPGGFHFADEIGPSRAVTLAAIRKAVTEANVFIFTLGLTEAWVNENTGFEYAACPGTVAGQFDARVHRLVNHDPNATFSALMRARAIMRAVNPDQKMIITVSPVPITATASGRHVLEATSWTKSTLRAAAGMLITADADVDYLPTYELVTSPIFGGRHYAPNKRQITPEGVLFVMDHFFADQERAFGKVATPAVISATTAATSPDLPDGDPADEGDDDDLRCEEELLDAFSR